jgi:hypothetical protein
LAHHPPAGEVVISMRPVSVFANGPRSEIEKLQACLHGRWREAARAVMVLLSQHGLAASHLQVDERALAVHDGRSSRPWLGQRA